jgi:hypothetical protein
MMRHLLLLFACILALALAIAGRRGDASRDRPLTLFPDMKKQWKLLPQKDAEFFTDDGRGSRQPVDGTVARGAPYQDWPVYTGRIPGLTNFVLTGPLPVTETLLARGRQRFEIHCQPCHGPQADGEGIMKKIKAMGVVANLHDRRIVELADGEIFHTLTRGRNLMSAYGPDLAPQDRWAVIAYLRVLQRAQLGTLEDVPAPNRAGLKN